MLEPIADLPPEITGMRATGRLRREDYRSVLAPALDQASREGRKLRLLFEVGPEFETFSLGAAWEEARLARRQSEVLNRCAIVSDSPPIRKVAHGAAKLAPFAVRVFDPAERQQAIDWLVRPPEQHGLSHHFRPDLKVLVIRPCGALQPEDFEALALTIETLVDAGHGLRGIVVHSRSLPSWSSPGSIVRHLLFARAVQQHVRRVALAVGGPLTPPVVGLTKRFVRPQVKGFSHDEIEQALFWAAGAGATEAAAGPGFDAVHEAGIESFPASDPPSFTPEK